MERTKIIHQLRIFNEEMEIAIPVFSERYRRRGAIVLGKTKAALIFKSKGKRVVLPLIRDKVLDKPEMAEDYGFLRMNMYLDDNEPSEYPELDIPFINKPAPLLFQ